TLSELLSAVHSLLELGEFVHADVRLRHFTDSETTRRVLMTEQHSATLRGVSLRNGMIEWSWSSNGVDRVEANDSGRSWTLRLPLSTESGEWGYINLSRELEASPILLDINYLCYLFQREMAQAAQRVFCAGEDKTRANARSFSAAGH